MADSGATYPFTLVTGGARSGKSAFAERMAADCGGKKAYIATAEALDGEMAERVRKHREARGGGWVTVEETTDVTGALGRVEGCSVVLIDCLTLWLTNLMGAGLTDGAIMAEAERLASACSKSPMSVYAVTNEVGLGIVPDNAMARRFRDLSGLVNQAFARAADEVYFVAAGLQLKMK